MVGMLWRRNWPESQSPWSGGVKLLLKGTVEWQTHKSRILVASRAGPWHGRGRFAQAVLNAPRVFLVI